MHMSSNRNCNMLSKAMGCPDCFKIHTMWSFKMLESDLLSDQFKLTSFKYGLPLEITMAPFFNNCGNY